MGEASQDSSANADAQDQAVEFGSRRSTDALEQRFVDGEIALPRHRRGTVLIRTGRRSTDVQLLRISSPSTWKRLWQQHREDFWSGLFKSLGPRILGITIAAIGAVLIVDGAVFPERTAPHGPTVTLVDTAVAGAVADRMVGCAAGDAEMRIVVHSSRDLDAGQAVTPILEPLGFQLCAIYPPSPGATDGHIAISTPWNHEDLKHARGGVLTPTVAGACMARQALSNDARSISNSAAGAPDSDLELTLLHTDFVLDDRTC